MSVLMKERTKLQKTRRMSSDLTKRTLFGALFLAVMICALLFSYGAFCLMMYIMYGTVKEFLDLTVGKESMKPQRVLSMLAGLSLLVLNTLHCQGDLDIRWTALSLIPVIAIPLSFVFSGKIEQTDKLMPVYSALVYIALPIALSPFLLFSDGEYSSKLMLSLFILIWVSDSGAYCFGSAFGQKPDSKKLAPSISPKKSWWGFWGSVVAGIAAGAVLHLTSMLQIPLVHCLVLGAIVPPVCVCGDLVESMWKRRYAVKDSGNFLPGHGGYLDRFDSSLAAIPVAAVYLMIFGLI